MDKFWPPKEIPLADISDEDLMALDTRLDTMARAIALNLDFSVGRAGGEVTPEAWYAEMSTPTIRVMTNWLTVLQQARAVLAGAPKESA
jgi:hypothetical protein